jgi:hypothetical protein
MGQSLRLVARVEAKRRPIHGEVVRMQPRLGDSHLFHPVSEVRLGD